jgi:hypothetical protein
VSGVLGRSGAVGKQSTYAAAGNDVRPGRGEARRSELLLQGQLLQQETTLWEWAMRTDRRSPCVCVCVWGGGVGACTLPNSLVYAARTFFSSSLVPCAVNTTRADDSKCGTASCSADAKSCARPRASAYRAMRGQGRPRCTVHNIPR